MLLADDEKIHSLFNKTSQSILVGEIIRDGAGRASDYVIADVNPAHELVTGRKKDGIIGRKSSELCRVKAPRNRYLHIFSKAIESYKPISFEDYYKPLSKYFYFSVFPVDEKTFITMCLDITRYENLRIKLPFAERNLNTVQANFFNEEHERAYESVNISKHMSQEYVIDNSNFLALWGSNTSTHMATNLTEIRVLIEELLNRLSSLNFEMKSQSQRNNWLSHPALTRQELVVLKLVAEGRSTKEIANDLCLSAKTVDTHRKNIMDKLNIHNVADLVKYSIREGLTSL